MSKYILIGRVHINGKNKNNSWDSLSNYLSKKIVSFENTKALMLIKDSKNLALIKAKIKQYNKKNYTDFFVGR